jgi:hypothetical protein
VSAQTIFEPALRKDELHTVRPSLREVVLNSLLFRMVVDDAAISNLSALKKLPATQAIPATWLCVRAADSSGIKTPHLAPTSTNSATLRPSLRDAVLKLFIFHDGFRRRGNLRLASQVKGVPGEAAISSPCLSHLLTFFPLQPY